MVIDMSLSARFRNEWALSLLGATLCVVGAAALTITACQVSSICSCRPETLSSGISNDDLECGLTPAESRGESGLLMNAPLAAARTQVSVSTMVRTGCDQTVVRISVIDARESPVANATLEIMGASDASLTECYRNGEVVTAVLSDANGHIMLYPEALVSSLLRNRNAISNVDCSRQMQYRCFAPGWAPVVGVLDIADEAPQVVRFRSTLQWTPVIVTDEDGIPLEGALVTSWVARRALHFGLRDLIRTSEIRASQAGWASVPVRGNYDVGFVDYVIVTNPGYVVSIVPCSAWNLPESERCLRVKLAKRGAIKLLVLDVDTGMAVPDAIIELRLPMTRAPISRIVADGSGMAWLHCPWSDRNRDRMQLYVARPNGVFAMFRLSIVEPDGSPFVMRIK